jgi:hypothetical protein
MEMARRSTINFKKAKAQHQEQHFESELGWSQQRIGDP